MKNLTIETKYEVAAQMVIMDILEKDPSATKEKMIEYFATPAFRGQVESYVALMSE